MRYALALGSGQTIFNGESVKSLATGVCFRLPSLNCIPQTFEKYIHGEWIDRNPLPVRVDKEDGRLLVSYDYKESLRIVIPWEIEGLGVFFLKTVSLPKDDRPYDLVLELARGTVGRLIDQTENWKASGLRLSDEFEDQLRMVRLNLRRATFSDDGERYQFALVAIGASVHLMNEVGGSLVDYVFALRAADYQPNTALLGAPIYPTKNSKLTPFSQVFNTALISPAVLKEVPELDLVKSLHAKGTTTCGTTTIDFRAMRKADFSSIDDAELKMIQCVDQQLDQGLSACKILYPIASLGFDDGGGWNDQEQIHLTYELLTHVRGRLNKAPLVVGIDQPFGEGQIYRRRKGPLQFADALIRMETPISAFCLEVNLGYYPDGTWIRDLFSFNDLLDSWAQFDYPLILQLRIPGGVHSSEDADGGQFVAAGFDSQASWLEKISLLALAKHNVAGVFYAQIFDSADDEFFGAGLISTQMNEKPALDALCRVLKRMT